MGDRRDAPAGWDRVRPAFESIVFRAGVREVARELGMGPATVYRLVAGEASPQPRTLRDIEAFVDGNSHSEHLDGA